MNLNSTAQTNATWELELELLARAVGASASMLGVGSWRSAPSSGPAAVASGGVGTLLLPTRHPPPARRSTRLHRRPSTCLAPWSTASASNSITLHNFSLQALN
jgi:hypothetical protein